MMFASLRSTILFVVLGLACSAVACTSAPDDTPSPPETKAGDLPPEKDPGDPGARDEQATASKPSADQAPSRVLFRNVHVFDGKSETRTENTHVLVEGNLIKAVSTELSPADGTMVIDGEGIAYTEALRAAGVPVRHAHEPAMPHGFISMSRLCSEAGKNLETIASEIRAMV